MYFISLKPSKARFDQLPRQAQVNASVRRLAVARADLNYVDVASAMLADGKPRDIFQDDALHMTDAGYRIWTRILRPKVARAARPVPGDVGASAAFLAPGGPNLGLTRRSIVIIRRYGWARRKRSARARGTAEN